MKRFILAALLVLSPSMANAVVSTTTTKNTYSCDGTNSSFSYTFPIIASTDIKVYVTDSAGVVTIPVNFSVNTGTSKVTYPTTGTICPSGSQVTLVRSIPLLQSLVLTTQGPFPAASLNTSHDKLTMMAQQLQEQLNRTVILPITSTSAPTLPTPSTGYSLVWDASGNLANSLLVGPQGPAGPAGPSGSGAGDVLGPTTNSNGTIPVWNGANTKTLSNGWTIGTSANNIVQVGSDGKLPILDGSKLTNVPLSVSSVSGATFTLLGSITAGAGSIPAANITSLPDTSLAKITTGSKVSGSALIELDQIPYAAGKIPAANILTIFGARVNKTNDTIYLAATDGIVVGHFAWTGSTPARSVYGYTDSSNPPTTEVAAMRYDIAAGIAFTVTFPVLKGNYYRVAASVADLSTNDLWFTPVGN